MRIYFKKCYYIFQMKNRKMQSQLIFKVKITLPSYFLGINMTLDYKSRRKHFFIEYFISDIYIFKFIMNFM